MTRLAIFTDLDGTLLDHHDYGFEPALPLLARLKARGDAVIPVTSKTPAEVLPLLEQLALPRRFIAENGCAVSLPPTDGAEADVPVTLADGCPHYAEIVQTLHTLREARGYHFVGFADMSTEEVAGRTGLPPSQAELAKQRTASEPLVWEDTRERLSELVDELQALGLRVTEGGRFAHVMGRSDKGSAVRAMFRELQRRDPTSDWRSVALGDAPNDMPMLDSVDVAVVIPSERDFLLYPRAPEVVRATKSGPHGWAQSIENVLAHHGG